VLVSAAQVNREVDATASRAQTDGVRWAAIALVLGAALLTQSASATLPGRNGRIGFIGATKGRHGLIYALYTIRPDGSGLRRITTQVTEISQPSWSPDGTQIVFASRGFLWTMRGDGSRVHRLKVTAFREDLGGYDDSVLDAETPVWSADGRRIVFAYGGNERHSNAGIGIFTVAPAGGQAKKIYDLSDVAVDSPGGLDCSAQNKLAFGGYVVGDELDEIFVKPAAGKAHSITHPPDDAGDVFPSWSPDGRRIAFTRFVGARDSGQILVVDATGANEHALPLPASVIPDIAAWSPDARFIAYAGDGTRKIHIADVTAGTEQVLTVAGVQSVSGVTWQRLKG
jgi:Tol biopolymer transport system component